MLVVYAGWDLSDSHCISVLVNPSSENKLLLPRAAPAAYILSSLQIVWANLEFSDERDEQAGVCIGLCPLPARLERKHYQLLQLRWQ
jgi:hypothetical protein